MHASFSEDERHQCGRRRYDRVTGLACKREPTTVAAAFRQRLPTGCQHDEAAVNRAVCRHNSKCPVAAGEAEHATTGEQLDASVPGGAEERIQHVTCSFAVGKQLAARLFVQGDASLTKERNRIGGCESLQDPTNDAPASAPEIALRHIAVRHIAAAAPADEDLRAGSSRALDEEYGTGGVGAAGEDRRRKAGGAAADDHDVGGTSAVTHVLRRETAELLYSRAN